MRTIKAVGTPHPLLDDVKVLGFRRHCTGSGISGRIPLGKWAWSYYVPPAMGQIVVNGEIVETVPAND